MSLDTSLLFRPTYPKIFGKLEILFSSKSPPFLRFSEYLIVSACSFSCRVRRGTSSRDEETYHGNGWCYGHNDSVIPSHRRAVQRYLPPTWSALSILTSLPPLSNHSIFFFSSLYRWRVQGASQESQRQQWSTLPHSTSHHLWDTQGMLLESKW